MKVRENFVPKNFEDAICRGIPGFNNLEKAQRAKVAFYIWIAGTNRRKHRTDDGMSIRVTLIWKNHSAEVILKPLMTRYRYSM